MKNKVPILVSLTGILLGLLFISCSRKENDEIQRSPTITRGVYGQVLERYGDWQPLYDPNDNSRGYRPLVREVYVYEYTKIQDFEGIYYCNYPADKMPKPLVTTTTSEEDGFYQIPLEPGTYSLFVLEEGCMYANGGDSYGGIQPVTIVADTVLRTDLVINHGVD